MSRARLILPCLILLACQAPASAGDGFQLDLQERELRDRFQITALDDLSVGDSGYILANPANFCRWSDSEVRLLGRTLLTEPSEFGDRWEILVKPDRSVSLTYQIGTRQTDPNASLITALVAMSYASACDEIVDRFGGGSITPMVVSTINEHGSLSAIGQEFAELRPPAEDSIADKDPLRTARQELNQIHLVAGDLVVDDPWNLEETVSYKDGRPVISLYTFSRERHEYDENSYAAHFIIKCEEGVISVEISKPDLVFYAPNYIWVTYKVGNQRVKSRRWLNAEHRGLGLWSDSESTPFVQGLLDADVLLMKLRITEKEWLFLTFDIHGLREQLEPLAEACDWELPIN